MTFTSSVAAAVLRDPQPKIQLFCFPYAGGHASRFRGWVDLCPGWIQVCGLQLPGRIKGVGEPPLSTFEALIPRLGAAVASLLRGLPFAMFGHSLGALIAFETTRWLSRHRGVVPVHLFASGCRAPRLARKKRDWHELSAEEFVSSLRDLNATPHEILENEEMLDLLLPGLRADFVLSEIYRYTPDALLPCPITAIGGSGDEEAAGENLDAWRHETSARFRAHIIDGDHFFINSRERDLIDIVESDLLAHVVERVR